jgi:hypothetical protein
MRAATFSESGRFKPEALASGLDYCVHGMRLDKLEAVAKSIPLADHGVNRRWAEWQHELQLHELP